MTSHLPKKHQNTSANYNLFFWMRGITQRKELCQSLKIPEQSVELWEQLEVDTASWNIFDDHDDLADDDYDDDGDC
eukprot:1991898-Amphidinium_carterae.2